MFFLSYISGLDGSLTSEGLLEVGEYLRGELLSDGRDLVA